MVKVFINPTYAGPDVGDGGIRRVVEGQVKHLPQFGVEVVDREQDADLVAIHAGSYVHTNKPVVAHNHGLYWREYEWGPAAHELNAAVVSVLRRADAVTAPSNWVGYALKRGMNISAQTVYHGVDADEWEPGDKSLPYVLWNKTRVDPICDPAPVNALARLLPNVRFVTTFGDPAPNVAICGRRPYPEAKNLIQRATIYLCTARETFGIGTLEAMAAGALVVGYRWGGQAEIITSGQDGLLVPPGNVEELANAIQMALSEPAWAAKMAEQARLTVENVFTWERAAEVYASVYKQTFGKAAATKRVSVVITCYNLAATLPRAVASVDMADAEIVVVNDASPDETASVAERLALADSRIKVVTNESNLYLADSLNAGIAAATGRYVVPLDADNELGPGALSILAAALDADPDVDVAYGAMQVVEERADGAGKVFVSGWPSVFNYEQQMAHRNQCPSTSMYRRKWWERANGYRRRCRTAEDADFWCRVTSLGAQPKKVTEQVTLIYHDRSDSMSHVEADWDWTAWYTWSRLPVLTPWGAPAAVRKSVPSYEPPLVTVVIPLGTDHHKYIHDALDSLVAQTYTGWNVVVVDDRDWEDAWPYPLNLPPWVYYIRTDGMKGPAHARNLGIKVSETPWVLLLDADDYLAPGALEILLGAAIQRANPNEYYYSDWYKQEEGRAYQAPDFVARHLITHLTHSVTALYPRLTLLDVGLFDENLDAWEDWDLVLKLIEFGICGVHIPFPLFYYRYGTGQRREQLYADRERHTEVMKAKWRKYMVEGQEMPCGCSGGRTQYSSPVMVGNQPIPVSMEGQTLVEFTGTSAPRTYRGERKEYRFGSDSGHKRHYVNNEDLPIFQNRLGFRLAVADNAGYAILDAKGPPNREAAYTEPLAPDVVGGTFVPH